MEIEGIDTRSYLEECTNAAEKPSDLHILRDHVIGTRQELDHCILKNYFAMRCELHTGSKQVVLITESDGTSVGEEWVEAV